MIFNKIFYLFSESLKSILRAIVPSFISALTIGVSLVIISTSYYFYENLRSFTSEFKDEYRIEVFFYDDLNINNALDTFNRILLIDGVEEGAFIDKDAAAKIFKEEFDENIEEIIGMNPLPMSAIYGISNQHRNFESMKDIVNNIKTIPHVDEALFSKDAIMKFDRVIRNLLSFSFILGLSIVIIAIFFVSNTILLIIHSKQSEIKTMQLLGATNLFIKIPYITNGILLGALGSLFSVLFVYFTYRFSIYILSPYYMIPSFPYMQMLIINLILGPVLGLIGSVRALSSYMNK